MEEGRGTVGDGELVSVSGQGALDPLDGHVVSARRLVLAIADVESRDPREPLEAIPLATTAAMGTT